VRETPDSYIIAGFIPGMDSRDISLEVPHNGHSLTVTGIRLPSPEEEKQLKQQIQYRLRNDPSFGQKIHPEDEDLLLLRAGSGRFGRFSEAYQLPDNVDSDKIQASYDKGVLKVIVPKISHYSERPLKRGTHPFYQDIDSWW